MDRFKTYTSDEFYEEKEKRKKQYEENCVKSGKLLDKYEKTQSRKDLRTFFDFFPNVDKSYKDWQDGVEYIYGGE